MENASKALIIAGEILIGVLILSIAAYLIMSVSNVTDTYQTTITEQEINNFNMYFAKFTGREEGQDDITAQDIVSAVYYAQEFNKEIGNEAIKVYAGSGKYTRIPNDLKNQSIKDAWDKTLVDFIKNNTYKQNGGRITLDEDGNPIQKRYKCNIEYDQKTGLINKVVFSEN